MKTTITKYGPLIILSLTFFLAGMIFCQYFSTDFQPHKVLERLSTLGLQDWQAISGIFYGAIGLFLGYLFFNKRVTIDNRNLVNDRVRKRLSYIYDEFNRADTISEMILDITIRNDDDLNQARAGLDKKLTLINAYLDNNDKLLKFNAEELNSILKVHSFISNSEIIFSLDYKTLKKTDRSGERLRYLDIIQEARTICLQKMESV